MSTPASAPIVDVASNSVTHEGTVYAIRPLGDDAFTVLVDGVPVGRIIYTFGAANGVVEGTAVKEATLDAIAEAWFGAISP